MNFPVIMILLAGLVICAVVCVMLHDLVKAAIAMAATSAVLSILMFALGAPLVGVFELSICAGLIPVIFISTINMTHIRSKQEMVDKDRERNHRFVWLPAVLIVLFVALLCILWPHVSGILPTVPSGSGETAQQVLWNKRQVDLLGQIVIILTGVYGVIVFFKESDSK